MGPLGHLLRPAGRAEWRTEKLTTRAKKALRLAEEEGLRLQQPVLGSQHVLLGVVREGEGLAAKVLRQHGIELRHVREAVVAAGGPPTPDIDSGAAARQSHLTPPAEAAVQRAHDEARALGHTFVGTEHLLLAVLHEDAGPARAVLDALGADPQMISAEVVDAVALGGRSVHARRPKDHVVTCRVEDQALDAIDALVEAGIRSTRSDAAAWLIRSGIEANRAFFEQVYSTVGEIRRLRQQAQAFARQSPADRASPPES